MSRGAAWLVAALLALPAAASAPVTLEGVRFQPAHDVHGTSLALRGAALLRYKLVFKGYVAALYLAPETPSARVLEDVPKRLEIEYFWPIGAADFARATDVGIARNVDAAALAALRPRIQQLNALYQDVEPGDRYALSYAPSRGTELARNGRLLGSVPGADFGAAIFAIWLGDTPLDGELKRRLLGDTAAR
jgi:hypothetical protein